MASVQAVIAARVDRLDSGSKELLQLASVIGKEFPRPVLALAEARRTAVPFAEQYALQVRGLARATLDSERRDEALAEIARAEEIARRIGNRAAVAYCDASRAELGRVLGDGELRARSLERAAASFGKLGAANRAAEYEAELASLARDPA